MSQDLIENHWLNPATPEKNRRKKTKDTTSKGRIMQGEKGIGRFTIFKLGRRIDIISKTNEDLQEHHILYDSHDMMTIFFRKTVMKKICTLTISG